MAQELLHTFHDQVGGVLIVPGSGGVFEVALGDDVIFSRAQARRDPLIKELRDAIYERLPGARPRPHGL